MSHKIPKSYKASLDTITLVITIAAVILLVFIGFGLIGALAINSDVTSGVITYASLLILLLTRLLSWLYAPYSYTVDDFYLTINRRINKIKLKIDELSEIGALNTGELRFVIRIFGVGGLFGHFGKYYSTALGNLTFYATKLKGSILIITRKGENLIITPDQKEIVEDLKTRIKKVI